MRKKWLLAALGASGCSSVGPFSNCPVMNTIAWDGGLPDGGTWGGGAVSQADCVSICTAAGTSGWSCAPGQPGFLDCMSPCRGRAPTGLVGLSPMHDSLGSWLAVSAEMEAAAVHAFWQLADELEAHGIPGDAARVAAEDEVRHAHDTAKLSLRHGVMPATPRVHALAEPRSLEAIALDNAVEGCGRELFGATLNAWQADHAADPEVRALMRTIAGDELGHARLSHQLAETLRPRISLAMRRHLREAQEQALLTFAAAECNERLREQLGLMDPDQAIDAARRLLDS